MQSSTAYFFTNVVQLLCSLSGWLHLNCSSIGTGFNGAETNCRIAHNLGVLLTNSNCFAIFFSSILVICLFRYLFVAVDSCFFSLSLKSISCCESLNTIVIFCHTICIKNVVFSLVSHHFYVYQFLMKINYASLIRLKKVF